MQVPSLTATAACRAQGEHTYILVEAGMDAINGFCWSVPLYPVVLPVVLPVCVCVCACVCESMESGLDRVGIDGLIGAADCGCNAFASAVATAAAADALVEPRLKKGSSVAAAATAVAAAAAAAGALVEPR